MAPSTPSGHSRNSSASPAPGGSGKGILTATTPATATNSNAPLSSVNPADPAGNAITPGSDKPAAPVSAGNTVSLHQLVTGCKVFVERPAPEEPRKAEILGIRATRAPPRPPRTKDGGPSAPREEAPKPTTEYYVHYVEFNKRLDEWVSASRLIMSMPVEWPVPKDSGGHGHHGAHGSHVATSPASVNRGGVRPSKAGDQGLRKTAIKQAASKAGQQQGNKTPASSSSSNNQKDNKKKKRLTGAAAAAQATKAANANGILTPSTANAAAAATPPPSTAPGSTVGDEDDSSMMMNVDSPSTRSASVNLDRETSVDLAQTPKEGTPDVDEMDEDDKDVEGESDKEEEEDKDEEDGEGDESTAGAVIAVEMMDENEDADADDDADPSLAVAPNNLAKTATFSKEEEIESLRTHGSMTQSVHEVSRVKNLDKIQMGAHEVEAWYFSPYPVEYAHIPVLYICEFCLYFYGSPKMLERHRKKCTLFHPPGNEIYRHEDISFYEIDGKKQKTWCRNLCLLCKAFLDHKTLYYDVDPFMFYVMCKRDDMGVHTIGYFSKEKESAEGYNLACILTLPQYQRHGYGKLLIEFSYELSKKENKLGSPEKPLSDLGLLSYRAYWQEIIVDFILETKSRGREEVSIEEIAQKTSILHADIMHTAQTLQMLKIYKNQHVLVLSDALIEQHERIKKKKRRRINPAALVWKPPHFSKEQLRFGF